MSANPKQKSRPDYNSPIKIINNPGTKRSVDSCWTHGGLCRPSGQNLIMAKERAGIYNKNIGSSAIFTLCKMAKRKRLTNASIRSVVQPMMPSQKELTYRNIFYIRVKINKCLPIYEEHPKYEAFAQTMDDNILLGGLDDEFEINDDQATELATDLWLQVLRGKDDDDDSIINIQQYMELIARTARGFVYAFALDENGKVNGLVWQTATMRRNYELFGGYISLDTMKRAINKWLWPYMLISMYNEHEKMCLGGEAIMCGERKGAYLFLCQFITHHTPMRIPSSVSIVTGDGFFNQEMIGEFGFDQAKYLKDWFHLFDTGLKDTFSDDAYELLKGELIQVIKADSVEYFVKALENARTKLRHQNPRNIKTEDCLETFARENHQYSQYLINEMEGSRGLHGSSVSEQNHSSSLCHLNDGKQPENQ